MGWCTSGTCRAHGAWCRDEARKSQGEGSHPCCLPLKHTANDVFKLARGMTPTCPLQNTGPLCRPYAEKYAADEKAFFQDYAQAHAKLR